jgi:hypothetical protein
MVSPGKNLTAAFFYDEFPGNNSGAPAKFRTQPTFRALIARQRRYR